MTKTAESGANGIVFHLKTVVKMVLEPRMQISWPFRTLCTGTIMHAAAAAEQ